MIEKRFCFYICWPNGLTAHVVRLINNITSIKSIPLSDWAHLEHCKVKKSSLKSRRQHQSKMAVPFFLTWSAERFDWMVFSDKKQQLIPNYSMYPQHSGAIGLSNY